MTVPSRTSLPARSVFVVGIAMVALLAACSGSHKSAAKLVPTPSPSPARPVVQPKPVDLRDPLTGLLPRGKAPVVVLKVDNAPPARQYQRGLNQAALVYEELMEGGSTRMLAVFDNGAKGEVGPIRSVRESDPEVLGQFGPVALGFSGGNTGVKASLHRVVRAHQIFDASYDVLPGLYRLGERRRDARNFFTTPAKLAAARRQATKVRPSGFRFGAAAGGLPAASARTSFSTLSSVRLVYVPSTGRWVIYQDARLMTGYSPTNVIVQHVRVHASRYSDVHGVNTPYTVSIGGGQATLLRDGRRFDGTWKRGSRAAVTRYLGRTGKDLLLKPGTTMVLLIPAGRPLTVG